MYLNNKEEKIIQTFSQSINTYDNHEMLLSWNDGSSVIANFDTCFEDDNDMEIGQKGYEEFWTFVFKAISVLGKPPIYITEDEYFCVDYRNFPDEIIADGKKIN